ncbi:DEAD/DEAH box helicase [Aquimarina amphilecti]|uniref:DEAD/DEAH box helicase n=1 Tax=Aquimarina amphilecti TaxID=1038014 RepID=A0A1H7URE5_AQUAM|nr:DEAD/DEAH box helicase [Aquimarina amphilecti]SEL99255.1 DEAD/DEAH box helicase [Aquimarina amphilecti]
MQEQVFDKCHIINELLIGKQENEARQELIKLLDYHNTNELQYNPLVNHLIRETGLFPYLEPETSNWEERFIYNAFKVDVGEEKPLTLHREQSLLLKSLLEGRNIAVSAPTSFGKSFVIDAYIKIKKPNNVLIIVPTLALTDETRRRLYKKFAHDYKIITTSDVKLSDKNIFIFPQERAMNYINIVESFDIMIVDEFYKASSKFDKERSPSLIRAMIKLGSKSNQKYYLAPNITSIDSNPFTEDMEFIRLDFNTVFLEKHRLYNQIKNNEEKSEKLLEILSKNRGKSLIYAGTYSNIDSLTNLFLDTYEPVKNRLLEMFADWLSKNYDVNWSLTKLISREIGVHNGRLHRSLSQIQVKLFEEEIGIRNLISTSSIIEGVNTSAENVIIWRNRKGSAKLDDFTYKNIIGRGGRMFKHFIGKIYILEEPPIEGQTQLDIPFPDEILGDLNDTKYEGLLTKEQVAKLKIYNDEMGELIGVQAYDELKAESAFQSSNSELIKTIAIDLSTNAEEWNGLYYLNEFKPENWDRLLYKVIKLQPGNWDTAYKTFVEFIKIMAYNWSKSIPELLKELEDYDVGIDKFFLLERNVTYKFSALLNDLNTLQKRILKDKQYDISKFIKWCSHAFLPKVVFQLEEYGLPRMISKKLHESEIINFYDDELTIHSVVQKLNEIGKEMTIERTNNLDEFDKYILNYFFDGIKITNAQQGV